MTLSLIISLLINLLFIGMLIMIIFVALNKTLKGPFGPWLHAVSSKKNEAQPPREYVKYVRKVCGAAALKGLFSAVVDIPDDKLYPEFIKQKAEEWFKIEGFTAEPSEDGKTYLLKW